MTHNTGLTEPRRDPSLEDVLRATAKFNTGYNPAMNVILTNGPVLYGTEEENRISLEQCMHKPDSMPTYNRTIVVGIGRITTLESILKVEHLLGYTRERREGGWIGVRSLR